MQTIQINDGDRIRLVVLNVTTPDNSTNVTLRYSWTGAAPSHACVPDMCDLCTTQAMKVAARRFNVAAEFVHVNGSVEKLRDGQSTARSNRKVNA